MEMYTQNSEENSAQTPNKSLIETTNIFDLNSIFEFAKNFHQSLDKIDEKIIDINQLIHSISPLTFLKPTIV